MSNRLLTAFALSAGIHTALVGALLFAPSPKGRGSPGSCGPGPLCIQLCQWERPSPARAVDPRDYIAADIQPVIKPGGEDEAPISPSPPERPGDRSSGSPGREGGKHLGGPGGGGGALALSGTVRRVVYLVDRSASMGLSGGLRRARAELREALRALPPDAWFQVLFYNRGVEPALPAGAGGMLRADPATIGQALARIEEVPASGGTSHLPALQAALWLRPEAVVLITDADDLSPADVQSITRINAGRSRIHVAEVTRPGKASPTLATLASVNGGTHQALPPVP